MDNQYNSKLQKLYFVSFFFFKKWSSGECPTLEVEAFKYCSLNTARLHFVKRIQMDYKYVYNEIGFKIMTIKHVV